MAFTYQSTRTVLRSPFKKFMTATAQAAYSSGSVPGWTAVYNYATTDSNAGTNSFTDYVNDSTHQAVFAFKGSDDVGNFQDLANSE